MDSAAVVVAPPKQTVETKTKKGPPPIQPTAGVVVPPMETTPIGVEAKPSQFKHPSNKHPHDRRNTKQHGRGGATAARDGKRTFDRRSGTGRGKEIKKNGGGARNWGSNKNEARSAEGIVLEENNTNNKDETMEEETREEEEEEEPTPVEEPPKEEKEEDKTVSYEEYMKQKTRPENEMFAPVKERQVENEFANLQPKVAVAEDFLVGGTKGRKKKGVRNVEKKTLDVGFRVGASEKERDRKPRRDDDRRGRGRGGGGGDDGLGGNRFGDERRGGGGGGGGRGRGDGRGGRGRGEGRGHGAGGVHKGSIGINVNDSNAFPSL